MATDSNGASYVDCLDLDNPNVDVRIYYKKGDVITGHINTKVSADIKDIRIHRTEGTYYKVARDTVRKLVVETVNVIEVGEGENLYRNHRNKLFTKLEFEEAYSSCEVCSGYVDPDQPYKFAMNGEAICGSCCSDSEIMKYINVMG